MATGDGGKTWAPAKSGTEKKLMDVAFVGDSGWVVGYNGLILYTADGGKTWGRAEVRDHAEHRERILPG